MESSKDLYMQTVQQERASQPNELTDKSPAQPLSTSAKLANFLPTLRELDAATLDTLARALVTEVAEGTRSSVDLFTQILKLAQFAETVKENVKGYVYGKTLCEKGATFTFNGVELSPAELGVRYDFSQTGSGKWKELKAKSDTAKKELEEHEKFLKSVKGKLVAVNEDSGEIETVFEPIKSGQSGYKSKIL